MVEKHFELSDSNRDGQLDSREWLGYMREEDHHLKRDKATRSLRYIRGGKTTCHLALLENHSKSLISYYRAKDDFPTLCFEWIFLPPS